ncbi:MAG: TatD family hydrolase [Clostridia bacterium]|nr:TatD family hydrolase [Clostridia bacterium]
MINNIFDSHAHYDDKSFNEDRIELLSSLKNKGVVGIVNCGSDIKSSETGISLAEKFDFVFAAAGVHPHEAEDMTAKDFDRLSTILKHEKCVALGEIGLDYHYDFSPRDIQKDIFEKQLQLAVETDMPVVIHDREAHQDVLDLITKYRPKGIIHCFSGSVELAEIYVKMGMYIGLGGAVTFKNAKKPVEVAKYVPQDKLLVETDCPYMTPVPFRGQRNDSSFIEYVILKMSEIRQESPDFIAEQTMKNAREIFSI